MLSPILNININLNISFCANKNLHTKKIEELTFDEKIEFLKSFGLSDEEISDVSKQKDNFINQLIEARKCGANKTIAFELAKLSPFDFSRALDLLEQEVGALQILDVLKLDGRQSAKMQYLINKKIKTSTALDIAMLNDKAFERVIKLLKRNIPADEALNFATLPEEEYQRAVKLASVGIPDYQVYRVNHPRNKYESNEKIFDLMQRGIKIQSATLCAYSPVYNSFLKEGYSKTTSAILTSLKDSLDNNFSDKETKLSANIIRIIEKNSQKSKNFSNELIDFIEDLITSESNIEEFEAYISKIDFDKLKQNSPQMIKYTSEQLITFLKWHYQNDTQEFNSSTLDLGNLTTYLENNYLRQMQLDAILTAHPLTRREVGTIPDDWLNKVQDKNKATKEIYSAIKEFQGRKDKEKLAQSLAQILNKNVQVEKIGTGAFGFTYKITIENAKPVCLKIFKAESRQDWGCGHGAKYEIQTGLFLNKHSNDFVDMIFGKVETQYAKDGFLVTQFLDETAIPKNNQNILLNHYIDYHDDRDSNKINDIIIDYGGVEIYPIKSVLD